MSNFLITNIPSNRGLSFEIINCMIQQINSLFPNNLSRPHNNNIKNCKIKSLPIKNISKVLDFCTFSNAVIETNISYVVKR